MSDIVNLKPEAVWRFFDEITRIPRPSKKEEKIVAYLIELLGLFGVDKEPLEWRKVIGMGIALIGVAIFQWK